MSWAVGKRNWAAALQSTLQKYGLEDLWGGGRTGTVIDSATRRGWSERIRSEVSAVEEKQWRARMQDKKKLSEYRKVKHKLQREMYLSVTRNSLERKLYAELRLGCLKVRAETGRWIGEKRSERVCMVCMSGQVETARHSLLECRVYEDLRESWWSKVIEVVGEEARGDAKWEWLIGGWKGQKEQGKEGVWQECMRFVRRVMERRDRWGR